MPLVDVMLVLLIIFMVTAPMMQQGLEVNLPQARRATPVAAQPVYVDGARRLRPPRIVQLDKDEVRVDILQERVRRRSRRATTSRSSSAPTAAAAAGLDDVTDKLKEAGVEKVGLMSTEAAGRER